MRKAPPIAAAVVLAAALAGCGGSGDDNNNADATPAATTPAATTPAATQTTATTAAPAASHKLTVRMTEFAFDPKNAVAKSGKVTLSAPNDGKVVHELVVLKTSADPAHLPMKGDEVDESTSVGEIADVEPGKTKKTTLKLAPGQYAMVCALPGHYQAGMYGSLKVQ